jgi:D-alanyl-D-alanine dipeptidase
MHAAPHAGFVYLADVAPTVDQDIRYAGSYNFIGRPIRGYDAAECVLTVEAATALANVQRDLEAFGFTLRVYDGYRPQRAVDDFIAWSRVTADVRMKAEFYPHLDKADLFTLGYVAAKSGHSRGSTVDLTIERIPGASGVAPVFARRDDGTLDMGTAFDWMDRLSNYVAHVGRIAESHRHLLHDVMARHGFDVLPQEWWRFTLKDEPFPSTYFDFPIEPRS